MHIYADVGLLTGNVQSRLGSLGANAFEFEHDCLIARDAAAVVFKRWCGRSPKSAPRAAVHTDFTHIAPHRYICPLVS